MAGSLGQLEPCRLLVLFGSQRGCFGCSVKEKVEAGRPVKRLWESAERRSKAWTRESSGA